MGFHLVEAVPLWMHDGSEAIAGIASAVTQFFKGGGGFTNFTLGSSAVEDWIGIDTRGVDRLLIQAEINITAVGDMVGAPSATSTSNSRLIAVGIPFYDPFINAVPEPVAQIPNNSNVTDPVLENVNMIGLSVVPWQVNQAWEPTAHDGNIVVDANILATGTTPAVGRLSWVVELGVMRSTADDDASTGNTAASSRDVSVELLDRVWVNLAGVNTLNGTGASYDGTERIQVAIRALKYKQIFSDARLGPWGGNIGQQTS